MRNKNLIYLFSSLLAVLLIGCENPFIMNVLSDRYGTITNPSEIESYLARRRGGLSENDPIPLKLEMAISNDNWLEIIYGIERAGKFVELDLSNCKESSLIAPRQVFYYDGWFDPTSGIGFFDNHHVVSIILPNGALTIGSNAGPGFDGFTNLRHVTIPASCEYITMSAFTFNSQLTTVRFLGSDVKFGGGYDASSFPYNLDTVYVYDNDRMSGLYRFNGTSWYKAN